MLKREDCPRTKQDSAFSTWKVLVGPTDWDDYLLGKEGATRYRVHNLPKSPGPGIYELGVAASCAQSGREIAKLDPRFVVVAYLGQADSVRTRLQQYGRSGAHLGKCPSAACENDSKTSSPTKELGLFEEALSRGYPIVFRWAPLNNKGDAQRAELRHLNTFDYAWNKGNNGSRRPCDIFRKLDEITSSTYHISSIAGKLLPFRPWQVGIRIKGKLLPEEKDSFPQTGGESSNFYNGIFKFSKSRPRLVIKESHANDAEISGTSPPNESFSPLCGVILEDGFPCTKPPVQGRERCSEHKGMRLRASNSVSSRKGASNDIHDKLRMMLQDHTAEMHELGNKVEVFPQQVNVKNDYDTVCGVEFGDGKFCMRRPAQGRVRCEQHKGMRVNQTKNKVEVFPQQVNVKNDYGNVCGVDFGDGKFCMRRPFQGRVRCEQHKGMRVNQMKNKVEVFPQQVNVKNDYGTVCGVDFGDGKFCMRRPFQGRVRCEQHKGMRVNQMKNKVEVFPQQVNVKNDYGTVCGVDFGNGNFCMRRPARGRVRCEQHKGMRVK